MNIASAMFIRVMHTWARSSQPLASAIVHSCDAYVSPEQSTTHISACSFA